MGYFDLEDRKQDKKRGIIRLVCAAAVLVICLVLLYLLLFQPSKESGEPGEAAANEENTVQETGEGSQSDTSADAEDPQDMLAGSMGEEDGASVEIAEVLSASTLEELETIAYGIDVARYQGTIDWKKVAESGVNFAMIRVGYRTLDTGEIVADSNARYNMQEAIGNDIQIGAYFFSTAVTEEEAVEEADWVTEYVSRYSITYPIAYNCEGFDRPENRQYLLSAEERSKIAAAFLDRVYGNGYTPMFYAAKSELQGGAKWDTEALESRYKVWVAQYPAVMSDTRPDYTGEYAMWQYTNQGTVPGVSQPVDMDIAYFGYAGTEEAKNGEVPDAAVADPEALMDFTEVSETVTAKDATNLRDVPAQGEGSAVIYTLHNGETVVRTGISDSGWSRVDYNGRTLYAVSNYLTTDLTVHTPEPDDGLKTKFQDCNDRVTAKIEVNLRTLPSVTNPDSVVAVLLKNGEYVTRTGINTDYGWSRVDYNGQTLYCISSYLSVE